MEVGEECEPGVGYFRASVERCLRGARPPEEWKLPLSRREELLCESEVRDLVLLNELLMKMWMGLLAALVGDVTQVPDWFTSASA